MRHKRDANVMLMHKNDVLNVYKCVDDMVFGH